MKQFFTRAGQGFLDWIYDLEFADSLFKRLLFYPVFFLILMADCVYRMGLFVLFFGIPAAIFGAICLLFLYVWASSQHG